MKFRMPFLVLTLFCGLFVWYWVEGDNSSHSTHNTSIQLTTNNSENVNELPNDLSNASNTRSFGNVSPSTQSHETNKTPQPSPVEPAPAPKQWRNLFLDIEFTDIEADLEQRLTIAEDTLRQRYGEQEGARLFELYSQYAHYRDAAMRVPLPDGGSQLNPESMLEQLHAIRELARSLDQELRESVVDPSLNRREFRLKQAIILQNDGQYGDEKRAEFENLRPSSNSLPIDSSPHSRFQKLLALYARDLEEADEEEKQMIRNELHAEIYGDSQNKKL